MKSKIAGCTHHASKVLKMAGGGSVPDTRYDDPSMSEKEKQAVLDGMRVDKDEGLPVVVKKKGKIDTRATVIMRGNNAAEGFFQKMDKKYPREDYQSSLKYKELAKRKKKSAK